MLCVLFTMRVWGIFLKGRNVTQFYRANLLFLY